MVNVTLSEIRPKLPQDTIFLPTEDGVVFRRGERRFALKGNGVYKLISILAPQLMGDATLESLTTGLPPNKVEVVTRLIYTLIDEKILINHLLEDDVPLSTGERNSFKQQIDYLEHLSEKPNRRFQSFREARTLIAGSGLPMATLAASLVRNGLHYLILDSASIMGGYSCHLEQAVADARKANVDVVIERQPLRDILDNHSVSPELSAICYADGISDLSLMVEINRWCRNSEVRFYPGVFIGGVAHVGPIVSKDSRSCWMCAILRHTEQIPSDQAAEVWKHIALERKWQNDVRPESSPSLRIFANSIGFELFRTFTEMDVVGDSVLSLNLTTLESKTVPLLPHPSCPHCAFHYSRNTSSEQGLVTVATASPSQEQLEWWQQRIDQIKPLVDSQFGVFHSFDDDAQAQSPLFRSTLRTSYRRGTIETSRVPGNSLLHNTAARISALLFASGSYALSCIDSSRYLLSHRDVLSRNLYLVRAGEIASYMGGIFDLEDSNQVTSNTGTWVSGYFLSNGMELALPSKSIFPRMGDHVMEFEAAEAGVACEFTYDDATRKAICSLRGFEMLKAAVCQTAKLQRYDPSLLSLCDYQLGCLAILGISVEVWGVHTLTASVALAFCTSRGMEPERTTIGCNETLESAISQSLTELLAIETAGESSWTLAKFLPSGLGYQLSTDLEYRPTNNGVLPSKGDKTFLERVSEETLLNNQDIAICNITPRDLEECGLYIVRAVMIKQHCPIHNI